MKENPIEKKTKENKETWNEYLEAILEAIIYYSITAKYFL